MNKLLAALGQRIADYLCAPKTQGIMVATVSPELLVATLRPGDVLLVEGNARISAAIKYLTHSNWSHAALFVGDAIPGAAGDANRCTLVEADLRFGVRAVPLDAYTLMHTRICRPVGLSPPDVLRLIDYAVDRIGEGYDLKNLVDLGRYLLPMPPVPVRWRRRLIALGSGDPSRAICSTLIAQAFQALRYPILPDITRIDADDPDRRHCHREVLHIRDHSLYAPRDFDISPYFDIVKPGLQHGFDYHGLEWCDRG